ncbi:poly polymerase catalytic domain-containing protein [Xylaria sp. CBS 124048]|nr:poly polymerase catalytic domain-containing protein [Xylaria sp. CBS 124048]
MSQRTSRRRAAAPAPAKPPFSGFRICTSGVIPGHTQASIEQDFIAPLGGTFVKSISSTTTHLVASEADYEKQSPKVKSALAMGIPVLTHRWLEDCLRRKAHLDGSGYVHKPPRVTPLDDDAPEPSKSRKRRASQDEDGDGDEDDNDDSAPKKKKGKKGKGKGKAAKVKPEESKPQPDASQDIDDGGRDAVQPKKEDDDDDEGSSAKPSPKVANAKAAKSSEIKIPVDEGVGGIANPEVYIDEDGVIYDASLNQTNSRANNNKFYRIQALYSGTTKQYALWTRWGRVGEFGQTKLFPPSSLDSTLRLFNEKFKSKSGLAWADRGDAPRTGKYAFIEKSYEPDSENEGDDDAKEEVKQEIKKVPEPESKLAKPVQDLMRLIFNMEYFSRVMADLNYDSAKLPLGKLSQTTISRGFQALKDLSDLLNDPTLAMSLHGTNYVEATERLSNLFFTIIPHAFGRKRPPIIQDQTMLKREVELLESLSDMKDAAQLMKIDVKEEIQTLNPLDRQFQGLGLREMTPINQKSEEFTRLRDYLIFTQGETHHLSYELQEIFRVERNGEFDRFDNAHGRAPRDRRLLWHGSRCTNFGGILSQGLRIAPPEAPVTGYGMLPPPLVISSSASLRFLLLTIYLLISANYCYSHLTHGTALLLLCEAELGDPIQALLDGQYDAAETARKAGMLSTWGQGRVGPSQWKDAECVHPDLKGVRMPDTSVKPGPTDIGDAWLQYNEYICYDVSQVRLRYLLRVKII